MGEGDVQKEAIDETLRHWRQGDVSRDAGLEFVHFADLSRPHSPSSIQLAASNDIDAVMLGIVPIVEEIAGVVILTQTCDVIRRCGERPFVEVAPLVKLSPKEVEQVRCLKKPAFAYVPGTAVDCLVADLDRVMTVEKAVVAGWTRILGWSTDEQIRDFARSIARKRSRFAFPDEFVQASQRFRDRLVDKHSKVTQEGAHLRALREIRVRAVPTWNHKEVQLTWWFVKESEPEDCDAAWSDLVDKWIGLFDQSGRFRVDSAIVCQLDDITARDYVESDVLDLDRLSVSKKP